jgi:Eco57I restriction-modification methylase/TaqI-like C-terminal specificity domain
LRFDDALKQVTELVERFERNLDRYKNGAYNETQVRREFLDPFFEALGWDVQNEGGYAEQYKDVVHEDIVKIGVSTKAPDYSFRIGGQRKFFLEAKKPSVNIKGDPAPAYQLRRYAWSAKLPLSILSDFEEFAVYDCLKKPAEKDSPSVGRVSYFTFTQYPEVFHDIYDVFAKESVLKGSFDRYAVSTKGKRGTSEVDAEFLKEIESWREALAKDIAKHNPKLDIYELNFAVQQTIDRIVFLRIAEDRGVEQFERLRSIENGTNAYRRLLRLYDEADAKYNSGLFDFKADTLSHKLDISDKVLKDIIGSLYYPRSPYEFSVLGVEILGNVYEQFLGKVIRLTPSRQAKVEEKPEVKKAGGVYYTPSFVVDYIVKNTVGRWLEGKKPKQVEGLKVLDPACGSGSFLLGAYQYLLKWHRDYYEAEGPEKHAKGKDPKLFLASGSEWRLTTAEKKRILLNNIFGVDIDRQAVEVTKLSLLLRVLEGESGETLQQLNIFGERALPSLEHNIKCGNSLIGPDFYTGRQVDMLGDEEMRRVNTFDWNAEFPGIMKRGGFDCVIGNPPYVRAEMLKEYKQYYESRYKAYNSGADLYIFFVEKGLSLLREGGLFSYIVSSGFLRTFFGVDLRRHLLGNYAVLQMVDFGGLAVFEKAKDTYVCIPLISNQAQPEQIKVCKVGSLINIDLDACVAGDAYTIPAVRFTHEVWSLDSEGKAELFKKIKSVGTQLGHFVNRKLYRGILTGLNEAFVIDESTKTRLVEKDRKCAEFIKPCLGGKDIRRYFANYGNGYIIVIPFGWTRGKAGQVKDYWRWFKSECPSLSEHLLPFKDKLEKRQDKGEFWWELRSCDYYGEFDKPKIIYPDIAKGPRFYLDTDGTYITNTAYCLGTDDKYLLGILNSRLSWFMVGCISIPFGTRAGEFRYRMIYQYMEQLPIRPIDFKDKEDVARHDRMVSLVETMLDLNKKLQTAATPADKDMYKRRIDATDLEIDNLVYELYGLTDEEIKIVEGEKG